MDAIAASVHRQFLRILDTLADALGKLDDKGLRSGNISFLIPARLAYHVLGSVDFYTEPQRNRAVLNKLGGNWEHSPPEELPGKDQLLAYIQELRGKISAFLSTLPDAAMLAEDPTFPWTGQNVLERLMYAMRHAQHHVGQINAELRHRELPRGQWV